MKKLLLVFLVIFMATSLKAQEKTAPLYLLFEFMQVNDEDGSEYWATEQFWSGIHKQRVADKSIQGWDLWSLSPAGTKQGSQYLTVTLFASLKDMLHAISSMDAMAYAKKAYPAKTEKELSAMFDKTVQARDISNQVLLKQVDLTKGDFQMKIGTMATIDIMKQMDDSYEKVESDIFKPWHQDLVDKGQKGSWELLRAILPAGSEAYGTHLTISMFSDIAQLASAIEGNGGEMDLMTLLAVKEGLKSRDGKEVKIARLEMMVR